MRLYLQMLVFLVLPVLSLVMGFVPLNGRVHILVLIILGIIFLIVIEKISFKELGLRVDNIKTTFIPYSILTVLGVFSLLFLMHIFNKHPLENWWTHPHLQWIFLPASILQEFGYRAFFQTKLQKAINPYLAIFIISVLYSFMHILWKDPLILLITFMAGLGWGYLWYKYPNFYLLVLSHAILNFLTVLFGFFPLLAAGYFKI